MDISKLPRLSQTAPPPASDADAPADSAAAAPPGGFEPVMTTSAPASGYCACGAPLRAGARFCDSCGAQVTTAVYAAPIAIPRDAGVGAEVWLSLAIGALLLLMYPRLLQFLSHKMFGTFFAPYVDANGTEVPYTAQLDFWSDLGITLFAVVLLLEGVALVLARRRAVVAVAFGLTVVTTAFNFGYVVYTFSSGIAIMSALAVAFGIYIAIFEWRLLTELRPPARA